MAVEKGRQGHTFPPTIFLSIPLFLLRLVQSREFYDNYWTHHVKKISTALKEALFHQSVQAVAYQGLCLLAEGGGAKFKNRGYESQSELLLWFLFWRKLSGRIVYDFRLPVRFSHESLYGMSFLCFVQCLRNEPTVFPRHLHWRENSNCNLLKAQFSV